MIVKKEKIRNKCGNLKNGAACYAIIGLKIMRNLNNFHKKFSHLMTLATVTDTQNHGK